MVLVSIALLSSKVTPLVVAPADAFARQVQLLCGVAPLAHERARAAQQRLGAAQHLDERIQPRLLTLAHQNYILPCVVGDGDSVEEDHRELVLLGVRPQSREALGRIASDDVAHGNVQAHPARARAGPLVAAASTRRLHAPTRRAAKAGLNVL